MKKIFSLILTLAVVLSFAACTKDAANEKPETKPEDTPVVDTDVTGDEETPEDVVVEEEEEKEEKPQSQEKPADKPAEKPADKPTDKPATKPEEEKPADKPVEDKPATSQSVGNALLADFKAKAGSHSSSVSLAEALAANSVLSNVGCGAMPVEPGYLTGFDNAEIKGFKEGTMFAPMIGTIPFVGYVFILEDGVNASDFISTLKSSANLRWNVCTSADVMVAGSSGNKVFFVMCPKSFEE